mgnify:CR=1 FL=1
MADILGGLVLVNGTDIWTEYGVFLVEDRRGGMENLTAILTPSKAKKDTAVGKIQRRAYPEERGTRRDAALCPVRPDTVGMDEAVFRFREFPEEGPGRMARHFFSPA